MLMSDSLGGNAKTLMFVNVSPTDMNVEESQNSLAYAARKSTARLFYGISVHSMVVMSRMIKCRFVLQVAHLYDAHTVLTHTYDFTRRRCADDKKRRQQKRRQQGDVALDAANRTLEAGSRQSWGIGACRGRRFACSS